MRAWTVVVVMCLSLPLGGAEMERVLLPVTVLDVTGAHGSLWSSELWAHIRVDGVVILPLRVAHVNPLRAGSQPIPVFLRRAGDPPGQFIQVTQELLDNVEFNLRVRDSSRALETWGTELPVIRESEFLTTPIALLPLPMAPEFRNTVRIYAANDTGGHVRVRITVIDTATGTTSVLNESTRILAPTMSPFLPPYIEIALDSSLVNGSAAVARVDIEPLTTGLRMWAFATSTHNETQHFTTITPQ